MNNYPVEIGPRTLYVTDSAKVSISVEVIFYLYGSSIRTYEDGEQTIVYQGQAILKCDWFESKTPRISAEDDVQLLSWLLRLSGTILTQVCKDNGWECQSLVQKTLRETSKDDLDRFS